MASKRDEEKAWKKLLAYEKGGDKVLQFELKSYRLKEPPYRAYIEYANPFGWSSYFNTPMEAVDQAISMMEATLKGG